MPIFFSAARAQMIKMAKKTTMISVLVAMVVVFGVLKLGDIVRRDRAKEEQKIVDLVESYGGHIIKGTITIAPVQSSISITSVDDFTYFLSLYHPEEVYIDPSPIDTIFEFIHDGVKYVLVT